MRMGDHWKQKIGIRTPDMANPILSLSGGNQQKVLFARALGSDADIILMDDPMRGVDIGTKQEVYGMLRQEASAGRTFLWYTTEIDELQHCDRVYVFRNGRIVGELSGDAITEERVLPLLIRGCRLMHVPFLARNARILLPLLSLVAILLAVFWLQPRAMSYVGLNLLLNLALPIAFATIAQMFVITVNDLDLALGAYVGFVACVGATWLTEQPLLGIAALAGGILTYAAVGALIHLRSLPVHRSDTGHVFRLARPGDPRVAHTRRQSARLAARIDDLEDSICAVHHLRTAGLGDGSAFRADALRPWHGVARRGRQSARGGARRLVATEGQDDHVHVCGVVWDVVGPVACRPHHLQTPTSPCATRCYQSRV